MAVREAGGVGILIDTSLFILTPDALLLGTVATGGQNGTRRRTWQGFIHDVAGLVSDVETLAAFIVPMAECVSRAGMAPMELRTNLSIVLRTVLQFSRWIKIGPISVRYVWALLLGTVTLLIADSAEHTPVSRGDAALTAKQLAAVFIVLKSLTGHH